MKKIILGLVYLLTFTFTSAQNNYCIANYAYFNGNPAGSGTQSGDQIENFTAVGNGIQDISNLNSGGANVVGSNTYSFFEETVQQSQGGTIDISIQCYANLEQTFTIWVDWNQDYIFDPNEIVWTFYEIDDMLVDTSLINGSFIVPSNASLGVTRMRIRSNDEALPDNPCSIGFGAGNQEGNGYGETEDYFVNVVNCITNTTDTQSACYSFDWIDGNTYTSDNNTATHTFPSLNGCDSVVTLDLTITTVGTDTQLACDSLTWIDGITYTSDNNTATYTLTNVDGCDSVVTLDLTVNYTTYYTDIIDACGTYTWIDGITYSLDNDTAIYILTGVEGCDSVVTLNLNIFDLPTILVTDSTVCKWSEVSLTAFGGETYEWFNANGAISNEVQVTDSSFYIVIGTDVNGCENTDTMFIDVFDSPLIEGPQIILCHSNSSYNLENMVTPAGGNYSGANVFNNEFDVSLGDIGHNSIIYTYTDTNTCEFTLLFDLIIEECLGINELIIDRVDMPYKVYLITGQEVKDLKVNVIYIKRFSDGFTEKFTIE